MASGSGILGTTVFCLAVAHTHTCACRIELLQQPIPLVAALKNPGRQRILPTRHVGDKVKQLELDVISLCHRVYIEGQEKVRSRVPTQPPLR